MKAKDLLIKYIEIKTKKEKEDIPYQEKNAYLSGWLDCANYITTGEEDE